MVIMNESALCFFYSPKRINKKERSAAFSHRKQVNANMESQTNDLKILPFEEDCKYRTEIETLYQNSFPDSERKPFSMILDGKKEGKMELFYAELHEKPAALIFLIRNKKADILDYLAVDPTIRGHRIGSRILTWLQEVRKHPFIVEIESTKTPTTEEAVRRKRFYLSSSMNDCKTTITLFGVPMELLSWPVPVHYEFYESILADYFGNDLIRYVSKGDASN